MKKLFAVLIAFTLLFASCVTSFAEASPTAPVYTDTDGGYKPGQYIINTDGSKSGIDILFGPGFDGDVIGFIPDGAIITVVEMDGDWGYVVYNGIGGWIYMGDGEATYIDGNDTAPKTDGDTVMLLSVATVFALAYVAVLAKRKISC